MPTAAHLHAPSPPTHLSDAFKDARDAACEPVSDVVPTASPVSVSAATIGDTSGSGSVAAVGAPCGATASVALPDGWTRAAREHVAAIVGDPADHSLCDLIVQGAVKPGEAAPVVMVHRIVLDDEAAADWLTLMTADALHGATPVYPIDIQVGQRSSGEPSLTVLGLMLVEDQSMTVLRYSWLEARDGAHGRSSLGTVGAVEGSHEVVTIQCQCRTADFARWEADFTQMMGTVSLREEAGV